MFCLYLLFFFLSISIPFGLGGDLGIAVVPTHEARVLLEYPVAKSIPFRALVWSHKGLGVNVHYPSR